MITGSPDVVTALIDKNIVAHNGMIDEPVSIFLPSLQNIMSVLSARTGRTSLTRDSTLSNFEQRSGHESNVWQEVFSLTLHLSGFV